MENLRPHELAKQLAEREHEIVNGRVESELLYNTLGRADSVAAYLQGGTFEENEYGYASLLVKGLGTELDDGSAFRVGALDVTFIDPLGRRTLLGGVCRLKEVSSKATAYGIGKDGKPENLLPEDPRWDAVVGTVERAIDQSWQRKFGGRA